MLRMPGWLPAFGQTRRAQGHLRKQGVGEGDLFLFFGWFREVENGPSGKWRYRYEAPDRHVLFGWLQVGEVIQVGNDFSNVLAEKSWLCDHPHLHGAQGESNTVYVARRNMNIPGCDEIPGGGTFKHLNESLVLTANGKSRSVWTLPGWFYPADGMPRLSLHTDPDRWSVQGDRVELQTVAQGQEFVLDCGAYPEIFGWIKSMFLNP